MHCWMKYIEAIHKRNPRVAIKFLNYHITYIPSIHVRCIIWSTNMVFRAVQFLHKPVAADHMILHSLPLHFYHTHHIHRVQKKTNVYEPMQFDIISEHFTCSIDMDVDIDSLFTIYEVGWLCCRLLSSPLNHHRCFSDTNQILGNL